MRPCFRLGLRTVKTALAVALSLFVVSWRNNPSIFAPLAAIAVMSRTFDEGLIECRNQAVGILIGSLFGCATAWLIPDPPIWVIALGVMVIIVLCTSFRIVFSCSLSCAIFIIACMNEPSQVLDSTLLRLGHTTAGLFVGLLINYLIVPYNNAKQIYALLTKQTDEIPQYLDRCILQCLAPDLQAMDERLDQIQYEMTIYRHQRFLHRCKQKNAYAHMTDCFQLAQQMQRELAVLCAMASPGRPDQENRPRLAALGLDVDQAPMTEPDHIDDVVTNYHLRGLLDTRNRLIQLLNEKDQET